MHGYTSRIFLVLVFYFTAFSIYPQLKFIVEDFEGLSDGAEDMNANGIFTFGGIRADVEKFTSDTARHKLYMGDRYIRTTITGKQDNIGWGKGISRLIEMDMASDYFNIYLNTAGLKGNSHLKITLQDDDNASGKFEIEEDDIWEYEMALSNSHPWKLTSIPLFEFSDGNKGGDGVFNCTYKTGKLLCILFNFKDPTPGESFLFDLICFSKGTLVQNKDPGSSCSLGLWSDEGNEANFIAIAANFEKIFKKDSDKKPGVIHFFQAFPSKADEKDNIFLSYKDLNNILQKGYIPMITLENHFTDGKKPLFSKPSLDNVISGRFDVFFKKWANEVKKVGGPVLIRIFHEFNGNWYPWCVANNNQKPELLAEAFRHIYLVFKNEGAGNAKFIWCPNSMSIPQESWNFIVAAYPGDDYVDFTGIDIYNGAGDESATWRSFMKEGIETYFLLSQNMPNKPIFICEAASRERKAKENENAQDKKEWIEQMSYCLQYEMINVKLLNWFNEKATFKVNSSTESKGAYLNSILKNDYFRSGTDTLLQLFQKN